MASKFKLHIVTADGKSLDKEVEIVNVKTSSGMLGIMAHHLPLIAIVEISHLSYVSNNVREEISIGGGVLHVENNEVNILAYSFETKQELDYSRAEEAKLRAENRLKNKENIDFVRAELSLKRALNRLSLK